IAATLLNLSRSEKAIGQDKVLAVDWKSAKLKGKGAVWEHGNRVAPFLKEQKQFDVPVYRDDLEKLDWVIAARPPSEGETTTIPADRFRDPTGNKAGLKTRFFRGTDFKDPLHERIDEGVDLV